MNYYFGVFLVLISILGYSLFLKQKVNYNFGKSLFFSVSLIMFFMALFSFINKMLVGYYLILLFGFFSFLYYLIKAFIKKDKNLIKYFNNPSFFLFITLYFFLSIITRKINILMGWDECSYWATMVKRLFYYNTYIGGENFHSMYYPPALTSFNYFIVKSIGFADSSLYFSQYVFILCGLIYLIKDFNWKNFFLTLLIVFSSYMFLILLLKPYVLTLYSEVPLIFITAIALITLFTAKSKIDYYFVAILLCNATWIKSNGLMLCLLTVLVALVELFNFFRKKVVGSHVRNIKKFFDVFIEVLKEKYTLFIIMVSPFFASLIFKVFLRVYNISNPQVAGTSLKNFLFALLRDTDNSDVIVNFANALNKNYNFTTFNLTSMILILIFIIGFLIVEKICKDDETVLINKYIFVAISLSFILYSASLLYAYCFLFSRGEANILASFDRYMNSFVGCLGISFLGISAYLIPKNINNIYMKYFGIIVSICIICLTNLGDAYSIFKQLLPKTKTTTTNEIINGKNIAERYTKYLSNDDKVGFIIQGDYGLTVWASIYYMTPLKLYDPRFDTDIWSLRVKNSTDLTNTVEMNPDDYLNKLKDEKITHLIVENVNDYFVRDYAILFKNKIVNGLYKLDYDKNKLVLIYEEEI